MGCMIGENSITCIRGDGAIKFRIRLKDKQNNEWFSELDKERFERLPDMATVDVYDNTLKKHKQFIKKFLFLEEKQNE